MRFLAGAVGAVVVTAATAGTPSYGAGERACADGVLVVVGPPAAPERSECVAQPGDRTAAQLFEAAGHRLTRVQRFPEAVCRVDGEPVDRACAAMPPADAYWGLFHAEDEGGDWVYASLGVDSLAPAAGDAVALTWQDTASPAAPALSPASPGSPTAELSTPATRASPEDTDGVPVGVPLLLLAGLAAVVAAAAWRRRR